MIRKVWPRQVSEAVGQTRWARWIRYVGERLDYSSSMLKTAFSSSSCRIVVKEIRRLDHSA
jgi:hypothetical protein